MCRCLCLNVCDALLYILSFMGVKNLFPTCLMSKHLSFSPVPNIESPLRIDRDSRGGGGGDTEGCGRRSHVVLSCPLLPHAVLPRQNGRVAIVTGGTRGMGFETARHLASLGMHVILGRPLSGMMVCRGQMVLEERSRSG